MLKNLNRCFNVVWKYGLSTDNIPHIFPENHTRDRGKITVFAGILGCYIVPVIFMGVNKSYPVFEKSLSLS